ncbi:MAG TPA: chromate transporter [Thermotogota bacterium]|nr:chromate transporter [Thermotogota bacterium]
MMILELFWIFFKIGLFSFGGGYAMIPLIQNEIVSRGWLTAEGFANIVGIAEMTPGPIAINMATFVGYKTIGVFGSVGATLGVALPSILLILLVSKVFFTYQKHPLKKGLFYGMRPVIVGLILSAAYFIAETSLFIVKPGEWSGHYLANIDWVSVGIALLTVLGMRKLKLHPILLLGIGGVVRIGFKLLGL